MKPHSLLVLSAALTLLTGCLSRPALNQQTFALRPPAVAVTAVTRPLPAVRVQVVEVDPVYVGRSLVYRLTDQSFESDAYAQWLVPPDVMLQEAFAGHVRATGAFSEVLTTDSPGVPGVSLRVTELGGDFRDGKAAAVLRVEAEFNRVTAGGKVSQRKAYTQRVDLKERTAAGVVAALDQALGAVAKELVNDLRTFVTP
jgi:cholesterol transport system auxiliary component